MAGGPVNQKVLDALTKAGLSSDDIHALAKAKPQIVQKKRADEAQRTRQHARSNMSDAARRRREKARNSGIRGAANKADKAVGNAGRAIGRAASKSLKDMDRGDDIQKLLGAVVRRMGHRNPEPK